MTGKLNSRHMSQRFPSDPGRDRALKAAILLILSLAALPIGYGIWRYGVDIPFGDQWMYVELFKSFETGSLSFKELIFPQNEYRQLIPYIIYILLAKLSQWQVKWEMAVTLLMALHIGWIWLGFLRKARAVPPATLLGISAYAFTLLFTPAQYENWMLGMQLVYFLPVYALTLCITIASSGWSVRFRFLLISVISMAITLSSVNGFLCWLGMLPLVAPGAADRSVRRRLILPGWILLSFLSVAFYLYDYRQPGIHTSLWQTFPSVNTVLHFFIRLSGNGLGTRPDLMLTDASGMAILGAWVMACLIVVRYRKDASTLRLLLPWFILGLYGFATAGLVTFGRVNMGMEQALSPRYTGFTLFLVLGASLLPVVAHRAHPDSRILKDAAQAIFAGMFAITAFKWSGYAADFKQMESFSAYIARGKAGLLVARHIPQAEHQSHVLPPHMNAILMMNSGWLDQRGYIRPGIIREPRLRPSQLEAERGMGRFDSVSARPDSIIAMGTADDGSGGMLREAVIITCRDGRGDRRLMGINNAGLPRWRAAFPRSRLVAGGRRLEAWLLDGETGRFRPLNGEHALPD
jgi:hypothetical protein